MRGRWVDEYEAAKYYGVSVSALRSWRHKYYKSGKDHSGLLWRKIGKLVRYWVPYEPEELSVEQVSRLGRAGQVGGADGP